MSRRRRKLDLGPEVPISDLGAAVNELSQAQTRAWPGGSREAYERFLAHEARQGEGTFVPSNAEAAAPGVVF